MLEKTKKSAPRPEICSHCGGKKGVKKEEGGCLQSGKCEPKA